MPSVGTWLPARRSSRRAPYGRCLQGARPFWHPPPSPRPPSRQAPFVRRSGRNFGVVRHHARCRLRVGLAGSAAWSAASPPSRRIRGEATAWPACIASRLRPCRQNSMRHAGIVPRRSYLRAAQPWHCCRSAHGAVALSHDAARIPSAEAPRPRVPRPPHRCALPEDPQHAFDALTQTADRPRSLPARMCGSGSLAESSRLSSFSQNRSRLHLSRRRVSS